MVGGRHQILDVSGKIGVLELPLRRSKSCEVEPQNRNAKQRQLACDMAGREHILRACEAVCEQRVRPGLPLRHIETRCKLMAGTRRKGHTNSTRRHCSSSEVAAYRRLPP